MKNSRVKWWVWVKCWVFIYLRQWAKGDSKNKRYGNCFLSIYLQLCPFAFLSSKLNRHISLHTSKVQNLRCLYHAYMIWNSITVMKTKSFRGFNVWCLHASFVYPYLLSYLLVLNLFEDKNGWFMYPCEFFQ